MEIFNDFLNGFFVWLIKCVYYIIDICILVIIIYIKIYVVYISGIVCICCKEYLLMIFKCYFVVE